MNSQAENRLYSNTSGNRTPSYFEKNFALIAGQYTPPTTVQEDYPQHIIIRTGSEIIRVDTNSIYSIEAAGDYMCFSCRGGKTYIVRKTMKKLQDELDPQQFIRIHRSNMVNRDSITTVTNDENGEVSVHLNNDQIFKVSRRYKNKVEPQIRSFIYN